MKSIRFSALIALLVLALALSACGKEEAAPTTEAIPVETTLPAPLTLTDWSLSASTWSSPNGATVHISAAPSRFLDGQTAAFVVRLEGEEAANVPCDWDGSRYTASADLNAADGYCYYMILTDTNGTVTEVSVNTPTDPRDDALINLEDSLNSYCTVVVGSSSAADGKLTITSGEVQVQAPKINNDGQTITCSQALLTLSFNGEKIAKEALNLESTDDIGFYYLTLSDVTFDLPDMDFDQQLQLQLDVTLSNGQTLTAPGGTWYYSDSGLLSAVG